MRTGITVDMSAADRARLEAIMSDRNSPQKHVWRWQIVVLSADGLGTNEIMRRTGKSKTCLWRWQERFMQEGVAVLLRDKTRPSRVPPLAPAIGERVVALTQADPPGETTHWTAAAMARLTQISVSSVQRIWRSHGLQPHRVRQFKLSRDPEFVPKLRDIVGLYIDPPAHAMVLSVDEKSQIQALDRTQPGLPLKPGRCGTMTHDYKRNGTTTLFAALDVLEGRVIGRCMQRHRHQEFIRFLNTIEAEIPVGKIIHVILDNYGSHKHPKTRAWLARHPRFVFHYTPTSASWLNAVEGFFAKLAKRRLKRGVFCSIVDLQAAINRFLRETNDDPKPFTWTADPDKIIAAVRRGHQVLDSIHFRNGPFGVKSPSDDLAAGIMLPSVVDTGSPHHAVRWNPRADLGRVLRGTSGQPASSGSASRRRDLGRQDLAVRPKTFLPMRRPSPC
jgi:transposase